LNVKLARFIENYWKFEINFVSLIAVQCFLVTFFDFFTFND
jgi:hypothetical protein